MARFCPDCGDSHECTAQAGAGNDAAVRIAEIEARRDVRIAELRAQETKTEVEGLADVMEAEAVVEAAAAEGRAEGMETVIEAGAPAEAAPADPGPEAAPVVVEAPEPEPVVEEPPASGHHEPREPKGAGWVW